MYKKRLIFILNMILLASMLLGLVTPGTTQVKAAGPQAPDNAKLFADAQATAAACGVSPSASMGQDLELLTMNISTKAVTQLDQPFGWTVKKSKISPLTSNTVGIPAESGTNAIGVMQDGIRGALIYDTTSGSDYPSTFSSIYKGKMVMQGLTAVTGPLPGAFQVLPAMTTTKAGSPVAAVMSPVMFYLLHRDANGGIEYLLNTSVQMGTAWATIPGTYIATSDPVAVVVDMRHMLLFFRAKRM
jgi:hypothetical protein